MNATNLKLFLRHLFGALGGVWGGVSDDELSKIAGALMVAASMYASYRDKRPMPPAEDDDDFDGYEPPVVKRPRAVKVGKRDR